MDRMVNVNVLIEALIDREDGYVANPADKGGPTCFGITEGAAFVTTVANYRAAAGEARASDQANAQRVAAEQAAINERTSNDYESRLAAARSLVRRLRGADASPQPVPAMAEARQCPAYPLPPADLLKAPAKTDFLNPTASPPPSGPSSSTN